LELLAEYWDGKQSVKQVSKYQSVKLISLLTIKLLIAVAQLTFDRYFFEPALQVEHLFDTFLRVML